MRGRNRDAYEKHGAVFFVTFTTVGFIHLFDNAGCCDVIIENLRFYQGKGDFIILAYVIMPNHIHLVIRTADDRTVSKCIGNLKRITSRQISARLEREGNTALIAQLREAAVKEPAVDCRIWKPRFDCFTMYEIETVRQKVAYIHNNPVRASLAVRDIDWPYSSASAYAGSSNRVVPVDTDWRCLGFDIIRSGKGS